MASEDSDTSYQSASEASARRLTDYQRRPFLLIVRTGRIVTTASGGSAGFSGFPAYSQLHSSRLLSRGAVPRARPRNSTLGPL
jgi:hypothetical protein